MQKNQRDPEVDAYMSRSRRFAEVCMALREILLSTGLEESLKWAKPCYGSDGKNIVIIQEFKEFAALLFFNGALLSDPDGLLAFQGEHSRSGKRLVFTTPSDVRKRAKAIRSYVAQAKRLETKDARVTPPAEFALVAELADRVREDAKFCRAFEALTPGRQREYHIFVSSAKKTETRKARVEKCAPQILAGRGLRDR